MKAYNLRILLTTGLFFCFFHAILAEEGVRYYDVELVVFESLEEATDSNEIWPTAKRLEFPENTAILGKKFEGKLPPEFDPNLMFNTLAAKDYQLNEEIDNLKASEKYRVLLHTGWRQPGLDKKDVVAVYFNHAISEDIEKIDTAASSDTVRPTALESTPPDAGATGPAPAAVANLQGLITIALSRYLHLDVEMLYKKEGETEVVDMFDSSFLEDRRGKESVYYLKQNRRMRSRETHFIDHPKFSMLVRITPYEVAAITPPKAAVTKTN